MGSVKGTSRLRTRLPRLAAVWGAVVLVEMALYYFFLSQPYFRGFFLPFAIAVLLASALDTWRVLRGRRHIERRDHDRRAHDRRLQNGT
jgi:hypothetical protein